MSLRKLSILIPVYNEAATVHQVLHKVYELSLPEGVEKEIIVVNDGSLDDTRRAVEEFITARDKEDVIRFFTYPVNQGKGAALQKAIEEATGDYLVIQDADTEYDPAEYIKLLKPIMKGEADVVYGSRFAEISPDYAKWHTLGNKFLTVLSNQFTGLDLSDMETCYKVLPTDVVKGLKLREKRFGFEPEITAKIAKVSGLRVIEVPISYVRRSYQEGKKINWKDGFRAIYCIIRYRYKD